jgi:O-antigen biosynthesis protein
MYISFVEQYGRDEPTSKPQYNYIRPTDYGSSYCVMVNRLLFVSLGLYDTMYSPAWYDDTDAAFTIRKSGFK